MNDLEFVAIALELAGNDLGLAQRQQFFRPARVPAEKGQTDIIANLVGRVHPQGAARAAGAIVNRSQLNDNRFSDVDLIQNIDALPVHPVAGLVIEQILDPGQPQLLERLGQHLADALERLGFTK